MRGFTALIRPGWVLILAVIASGCDEGPASPGNLHIDALWPNEDGRQWVFTTVLRGWAPAPEAFLYPLPDSVPPAPSLDEIVRILDAPFTPPEPSGESSYRFTLRLAGERTTASGVEAQNLEALFVQIAAPAGPSRSDPAPRAADRPPRLDPAQGTIFFLPLLLHGGAFAKTDRWIGTYGDLDTRVAWKFLDRSLRPGYTFHLQLSPALFDDRFLHARVFPDRTAVTPAGTFEDAVEVVYVVDFGLDFLATDNAYGYYRLVTFGNVVYAPGVGPVASYERQFAFVGSRLGNGSGDATSTLVSVDPGPGEP